ncbi:response regulator transcription factor [Pseudomarimonas salicorniae]|uniref:Response regulator n=1 Tax=Pseudomarimonas salicorniae TaxID=2933270 RepID=A0ABT0GC72_9GAMM|nr:response regulator [Lysobacter sp. CAU 1642]MCK7592148.1 response regulator [Lysobacter sp. CAU 1642]
MSQQSPTPEVDGTPQVWVLDDDALLTELLVRTLGETGLRAQPLTDPRAFLSAANALPDAPTVLLCDLQMPGLDGISLARELRAGGFLHPIVLMSAHFDVDNMLEAMREGFFQVIRKPLDLATLPLELKRAYEQAEDDWRRRQTVDSIQQQVEKLTSREQEVVQALGLGLMNKQVADRLDLSIKTIEAHRQRIMGKLGLRSANALIRFSIEWRLLAGGPAAQQAGARPH